MILAKYVSAQPLPWDTLPQCPPVEETPKPSHKRLVFWFTSGLE